MSTESARTDNNTYSIHDFIRDLEGLYGSDERIYSEQIRDREFNTLDAMNQLRDAYNMADEKPEEVREITEEKSWDTLESLLGDAVEKGALERKTKNVDIPSETFPRKNLFYRFDTQEYS